MFRGFVYVVGCGEDEVRAGISESAAQQGSAGRRPSQTFHDDHQASTGCVREGKGHQCCVWLGKVRVISTVCSLYNKKKKQLLCMCGRLVRGWVLVKMRG